MTIKHISKVLLSRPCQKRKVFHLRLFLANHREYLYRACGSEYDRHATTVTLQTPDPDLFDSQQEPRPAVEILGHHCMASITVTPWRNQSELLNVRDWLFSRSTGTRSDTGRKACSQIQAWKLRGGLPHAVESTWYITEAILTDSPQLSGISALAKRSCYCTALCRFVTGLVDTEQDSKYKISMYDKAKELDLPASFVELRHEAIHGELPSLVVLRQAAEKALAWLWTDYWKHLDDDSLRFVDGSSVINDYRNALEETLQDYLTKRSKIPGVSDHGHDRLPIQLIEDTTYELLKTLKAGKRILVELVSILVDGGILVLFTKFQETDEAFVLWDQLLGQLAVRKDQFLKLLLDRMIVQLVAPLKLDTTNERIREGILMWLEHIYTSQSWTSAVKRARIDDIATVSTCLQNPNQWTTRLASLITQNSPRKRAEQLLGPQVADAMKEIQSPKSTPAPYASNAVAEANHDFEGWQRSRDTCNKPIGVVMDLNRILLGQKDEN
ncbi:MAG: hypothetical protein Q9225_004957 [Loekoesia sp. 1 TL-2023]